MACETPEEFGDDVGYGRGRAAAAHGVGSELVRLGVPQSLADELVEVTAIGAAEAADRLVWAAGTVCDWPAPPSRNSFS